METLKALLKQPFWVIAVLAGAGLVALPYVTIDKDNHLLPHARTSTFPLVIGVGLIVLGCAAFVLSLRLSSPTAGVTAPDLKLSRVKEEKGKIWTTVAGCEIHVAEGQLQDLALSSGTVVVLPCNEYFDDECAGDPKSALGAYACKVFDGQVPAFTSLVLDECRRKLGPGVLQPKTESLQAQSFGVGRCLLLLNPLGRSVPIALVSTTTQRAGQGLATRISYLFAGMQDLVEKLADARRTEIIMPVMGAGHGRIDPPLALIGLLLAVAEAARYGQGGQRLRKVTIVIFKPNEEAQGQVDQEIVRGALALVASQE